MRNLAVVVTLAALLAGCATATAPTPQAAPVDLTGLWVGSWEGYGVADIKRYDAANAEFVQQGDRGYGRFWLEGSLGAESVPVSLRLAGLTGVPVFFHVHGNRVVIVHQLDEKLFKAEVTVSGTRLVGRLLDTHPPGRFALERVPPKAAAVPSPPVAAAPASPPPPPPAPAPVAVAPPPPPPAPVVMRPAPQEYSPTDAIKPIHFDFDRSDVRPSDAPVLDGNARWLQANRAALLIVEGHCDERGTEAYNLALGERRARSARDYLVAQGVAAERITIVSYGEERPVCRDRDEGCWRENRRAAFVVKPR